MIVRDLEKSVREGNEPKDATARAKVVKRTDGEDSR